MKAEGTMIDCIWHTDETRQKDDLNMEFSIDECETRPVVFYEVNALAPCRTDGKDYCYIYANGTTFTAPFQMKEVRQHVNGGAEYLQYKSKK